MTVLNRQIILFSNSEMIQNTDNFYRMKGIFFRYNGHLYVMDGFSIYFFFTDITKKMFMIKICAIIRQGKMVGIYNRIVKVVPISIKYMFVDLAGGKNCSGTVFCREIHQFIAGIQNIFHIPTSPEFFIMKNRMIQRVLRQFPETANILFISGIFCRYILDFKMHCI